MANILNFNPQYPDLFLGAVENAGTFPNEKGDEVAFHNFLLDIALKKREVSVNTVSSCGYECLGITRVLLDIIARHRSSDISNLFRRIVFIFIIVDKSSLYAAACEMKISDQVFNT